VQYIQFNANAYLQHLTVVHCILKTPQFISHSDVKNAVYYSKTMLLL